MDASDALFQGDDNGNGFVDRGEASGVFIDLTINFEGNDRNRLNYGALASKPLEEIFKVEFDAVAELDLLLTLSVDGDVLPDARGNLVADLQLGPHYW